MSNREKQVEIAERLQLMLLERFEKKLTDNTLSPTDAATLARLLMSNGWNIDPARVPARLRDILTKSIDPKEFNEDDADLRTH